ncbi:MAG: acyl carrier protein [Candidatus Thorarchaeota archaeon]
MTDTNDKLMGILAQVLLLETENITDDLRRKDYEPWDSMAHLVLISEIENVFGILFEDEEVVEMWTVADVKKAVASKT